MSEEHEAICVWCGGLGWIWEPPQIRQALTTDDAGKPAYQPVATPARWRVCVPRAELSGVAHPFTEHVREAVAAHVSTTVYYDRPGLVMSPKL